MADRSSFRGIIRYWRPEQAAGLAVVDIPADMTATLGGAEFTSNTMPAGGGRLSLSVSRKMLAEAGLAVGEEALVEIERLVGTRGAGDTP